jgi:ribonuclease VapC
LEAARSPVTSAVAVFEAALDPFARYGKGGVHPAQLNIGDCFAYAVAKADRAPLPFKDEDFDKTDIPSAAPCR